MTCSHATPSWSDEGLQPAARSLSYSPAMGPLMYWSTLLPPRPPPIKPHPGAPSTCCFSVWRSLDVKGHSCFPMPGCPYRGALLLNEGLQQSPRESPTATSGAHPQSSTLPPLITLSFLNSVSLALMQRGSPGFLPTSPTVPSWIWGGLLFPSVPEPLTSHLLPGLGAGPPSR